MSIQASEAQVEAGTKAGREALDAYSGFYSGMVPDDVLQNFCRSVINAALNVSPPKGESSDA